MENYSEQYMELAGIALRARDTYKFENNELRQTIAQLEVDLKKKELDIANLTSENIKLRSELDDSKAFNDMLQKMIKKTK